MNDWAEDISLKEYTTFKTGGVARYMVEIDSEEALSRALERAQKLALPVYVLGGGSNVLAPDEGFPGVILRMGIKGRTYEEVGDVIAATIGAGEVFDEVVEETTERGWWGLENLSHIPGTMGAAPIQNIGAYGTEVGDCVTAVRVYDREVQEIVTLTPECCQFGYRDSVFKSGEECRYIVVAVELELRKGVQPKLDYGNLRQMLSTEPDITPAKVRQAIISIRSEKFPDWNELGTAGSFFKNPVVLRDQGEALVAQYPGLPLHEADSEHYKIPLGWVLDHVCQLRGYREGNVGTSPHQALVLVNYGNATTAEVEAFADMITKKVFAKTEINIEREVKTITTT